MLPCTAATNAFKVVPRTSLTNYYLVVIALFESQSPLPSIRRTSSLWLWLPFISSHSSSSLSCYHTPQNLSLEPTHSTPSSSTLRHGSKDGIVATNTGSILLIRSLRVAHLVELRCRRQHAAAEPHGVPLHMMRNHRHVNRLRLQRKTGG